MLILPVADIEAGMKLAMDVCHPERVEQVLLKRGYVLEEAAVARLRAMGVGYLYVDYPPLDDLDRHLAVTLSPARQMIYHQIKETMTAVQNRSRPTVGFADYYASVRELAITLLQQGEHPIYLEEMALRLGSDAISHATAVAQLSVTLGLKLERYLVDERSRLPAKHAREVINLGVGGMLHDVGKARLPEHLQRLGCLEAPGEEADRGVWEGHGQVGYEMIRGGVESSASAAVAHHHQHYDGSGFPAGRNRDGTPRRFSGSKIHVFARIIQAADLYDRLSLGEGKGRRMTVEVLHLMRSQYASWIDPQILRTFASVVPPFPPGVTVRLSDGSRAVVTALDPSDPYHPTVRPLAEDGWTLVGEGRDLRKAESPAIVSVGETCVRGMIPAEAM